VKLDIKLVTCPRCGRDYQGYPALSRLDNKTEVCSPCGTDEALRDMLGLLEYDGKKKWVKP
jgi:ribosomal protein S27AE